MTMLYRHFAPSNTSLSDDYDDEDPTQSNFFNADQPLFNVDAAVQPLWSSKPAQATVNRKASMKSPISAVPPEVLIYILKHLHSSKDLLSALRVSRTWCECAVELLWHKPAFPRYSTVEKMARLLKRPRTTFSYPKFIRRLNFLSLGSELRDETFTIFARCNRLERLTLAGCKLLSPTGLEQVLTSLSNLVAVDLTSVVETTTEVIVAFAVVAKRLQGINLANCKKVTDPALVALGENCPSLRRVKLTALELITDAGVSAIVQGCPLLLEIDLHQCELITDAAVRDIWIYSTHMREMRLSGCPALTDRAFPAPSRQDGPDEGPVVNPFPLRDATDLPPLHVNRTFEHLRLLDLTGCANITDVAIEGITSHAPKIRNLVLSKCVLLTDRSVEAICTLGRHLHYLHLGHASKVTDRSVKSLARSCTRIRYVDFANCTLLTDMSVFELSALPKLRRIGLVRVNNLTDEAIYSLAERHATLERIHLSYCDQISVMAIHFLLLKLHKLTHLSLTGVPSFRQAELQSFCRDAPGDFNSAQRQAFCVFSGKGVSQLRAYLTELFDQITEQNGTDDTEYEDEDCDPEPFHEIETPDAEIGDPDEDAPPLPFINANVTLNRGPRAGPSREVHQPRPHDTAMLREQQRRALRMVTIPAFGFASASNRMQTETTIQGATSRLNHLQSTTPTASTSAPARIRRPLIPDSLLVPDYSLAHMLSFVEPLSPLTTAGTTANPDAPAENDALSGAGFFPAFEEPSVSPTDNGTLTPDLNYAEIGHGRGATHAGPSRQQRRAASRTPRQPYIEMDGGHSPPPQFARAQNIRAMSDPGFMAPEPPENPPWSQRGQDLPGTASASTQELEESLQSALGGGASRAHRGHREHGTHGSARGRSVRRTIRNGLNAAENYATSFLFGRPPAGPAGEEGSSSGLGNRMGGR